MPTTLITGVNRGIGLELLRQYAADNWQVIGTCRDLTNATEAIALAEASEHVALHELDVTDDAAVTALAEKLSGTTIDVLILNAGVMGQDSVKLGELQSEDFRNVLNVNVVAQAMCLQAFARHVSASERRIIVGMGSFLGSMGLNADGGLYSYRAAKAGMHAIMVSASQDLRKHGVTAIVMHPGWVQTDMGGQDATISCETSVTGMRTVIDGLTPKDSGRFLSYAGEEMAW